MEETVRFVFSDGVAKAAPALTLTSADPVTARCRRVKSVHEIELIRLTNQIMVITENGAELLTGQAPSLEHPFG